MPRKIHFYSAIGVLALIAFAVVLAVFLSRKISEEPGIEYSSFTQEVAATQGRIKSFITLKPEGTHHIGDIIEMRLVIGFDPLVWEVPDEMLRHSIPLSRKFEVRSKKIRNFRVGEMAFLEAQWLVQCLECRDGKYPVSFSENGSQRMLVKNKQTNRVTSLDFPNTSIRFLPIPDNQLTGETLPRLPVEKNYRHFVYFALSGICVVGAFGLLLFKKVMKRKKEIPQVTASHDRLLTRLLELTTELEGGGETSSIAHSLYTLLLIFLREHGKNSKLASLIEELNVVYSDEEIKSEMLEGIISRAKAEILEREA